ncbi:uncharacterized protein LOC144442217 [Glandiceps talaboti]
MGDTATMANIATKGDIYAIVVKAKKEKTYRVKAIADQLRSMYPAIKAGGATDLTLYNRCKAIDEKCKKMVYKKQHQAKDNYLREVFQTPTRCLNEQRMLQSAVTKKEKVLSQMVVDSRAENRTLKRKINMMEDDNFDMSQNFEVLLGQYTNLLCSMDEINDQIRNLAGMNVDEDLAALRKRYQHQSELLENLKTKLNNNNARNLNKKLKRREHTIVKLTEANKEKEEDIDKMKTAASEEAKETECIKHALAEKTKEIETLQKAADELRTDKLRLQKRLSYYRNKDRKTKIDTVTADLHQHIFQLQKDNTELQHLVDLLENDEIETFYEGKYRDEVREVVMDLLSLNVSMNSVNKVIRTVLKKLANKDVSRLPSNALKTTLLVEAKHLAFVQASDALKSNPDNCLHQDATSKFHRHYQGFQVTLSSGKTFTLGLQETSGGTTADVLQAFTDIIDDMADVITSDTEGNAKELQVAQLITSLRSTMSDQGPTSETFNKEVEILRTNLLPKVTANWNSIPDGAKTELQTMFNFYCKVHILPNFASESDKVLRIFEKDIA